MGQKFGTFKGVFVPSTEAILGTVLFLLLPTLTGDLGLFGMLAVVVLAHTVTVATAFSMAECATNLNDIGGGGMYALSKRSLGRAFGGSIGVQLYFAQAASIGFYCIGFAEPLQPLLSPLLAGLSLFQGSSPADILLQKQILASIVFCLFFIIVIVGADFTLKIQMLILVVLGGSVLTIFLSPFLGLDHESVPVFASMGKANFFGNRTLTVGIFFLAFAQFFPAVCGIDAGVGMSGDLEDPKKSLVKGTFRAIGITFCVYIISTIIFSLMRKDLLVTGYRGGSPVGILLTDLLGFGDPFPRNLPGMMVLLGVLFATSSSALSCFMTAPRTAQSLARDGILPGALNFLKNDFFKGGNEPRYSTLVTFFVGISVIWMGSINVAATIVGICFLAVYGWLNGSAFLERVSGNPSFRPTFRGHWLISLYGFLSSIIAIVLFSWIIGVAIMAMQYLIFQLVLKYKAEHRLEGVWWGVLFSFVSKGLSSLNKIMQGTKNWRPILTAVAFAGKDNNPHTIAYLARLIALYKGLVNLNIIDSGKNPVGREAFLSYNIPVSVVKTGDPTQAIMSIIQVSHLGGLLQNTVLLEFSEKIDSVKIINRILSQNQNMLMLKNGEKYFKNEQVDIWWRGERNGNLMVLLGFLLVSSIPPEQRNSVRMRIIRKLGPDEAHETAANEMKLLLGKARLRGEVVILSFSEEPFTETLERISEGVDLIMMGVPGDYTEREGRRLFNLNEFFFSKEIRRYDRLPAILFVKSAGVMSLVEE